MARHELMGKDIVDNSGNVYTLGPLLGSGVEGETFKATVKKVTNKRGLLSPGDEVAIKKQSATTDNDTVIAREREKNVLKKEGTLLSSESSEKAKDFYMVQPIFPGIDLRSAMYKIQEDDHGQLIITGKKEMTFEQREQLVVSLLNDYFALQQLGIVHCDIKPDNILYDRESNTAKIIDMGQAFEVGEGTPHERFQGPGGFLYFAPEAEGRSALNLKNTPQTDMYGLGMLIASIYSDNVYEKDKDNIRVGYDDNESLAMRGILSDVIGEKIEHKKGMPDELLKIVRHMTSIDVDSRPENIALANGADKYSGTKEIFESQKRTEEFIKTLLEKSSNDIHDARYSGHFKNTYQSKFDANNDIKDLTILRTELKELLDSFPEDKVAKSYLNQLVAAVDKFAINEAQKIQALRTTKVQESQLKKNQEIQEIGHFSYLKKEILSELNAVADENKKVISPDKEMNEVRKADPFLETAANVNKRISPISSNVKNMSRQTSMTLFYNAKKGPNISNYNDIGKIFLSASKEISGADNTKNISETLSKIVKKIYENKEITKEKQGELSSNVIALIDKCNKYIDLANVAQEKPNRSRLKR